jgi:hypothetical protein
MKRASSEARNSTLATTSSTVTHGVGSRLPAERSAISSGVAPSSAASPSLSGVSTPVGCRVRTRMFDIGYPLHSSKPA